MTRRIKKVEYFFNCMEIDYADLNKPGNRLGSGAFGRVFESTLNGQTVAYKIMKHAIHSSIFVNEINIMKRLSHPNILQLIGYSVCEAEKFMCIIMERAVGIDLLDYIHHYDVSDNRKKQISVDIIETLAYMHSQCIVYRDLKPDNIMIDVHSCRIKFIDFGLAAALDPPTMIRGMAGTHGYIAPEIIADQYYSFPIDIYSYGMTLFYIWSEHCPKKHSLVRSYLRATPRRYKMVICECISIDPKARPTAPEIVERIRKKDTTFCDFLWGCF